MPQSVAKTDRNYKIKLKSDIFNAKINSRSKTSESGAERNWIDGKLICNLIKIQILICALSAGSCLYYKRIRFANIIDERGWTNRNGGT